MNCSTVLVQNTWGMHLNFEGNFSSPPSCPSWLTQLQQQDWQRRGIVVWDADLRIITHLYAGYALELLEHLQGNDTWKTNGLVIGSPAFQLSTSSVSTPSVKIGGSWLLENQMELRPDQVQVLIEFLTVQESLLKRISSCTKKMQNKPSARCISLSLPMAEEFGKERRVTNSLRLQNRTFSRFSSHAETISQFIKPPRFAMPRQNRSEPGSEKGNLKHSIYPV
jgi:hypothetical protein